VIDTLPDTPVSCLVRISNAANQQVQLDVSGRLSSWWPI
jgi:hypothetical protein